MAPIPKEHPLHRWFAALVEACFQADVGITDPQVLDYLAGLLTEFIHVERINLMTDGSGRRIEDVATMLTMATLGDDADEHERRRMFHRHVGDFTLFWTGIYPENLRRMRRQQSPDALISYFEQGKRSYDLASQLSDDETRPSARVLRRLSDDFEYVVYGLGLVRRQWEHAENGPAAQDSIWT